MKHDWHAVRASADALIKEPRRRCANCQREQERITEHLWGRVIRSRWWPLVGKCRKNTN